MLVSDKAFGKAVLSQEIQFHTDGQSIDIKTRLLVLKTSTWSRQQQEALHT